MVQTFVTLTFKLAETKEVGLSAFPISLFLQVKRPITLHEGHLDFVMDVWDSQGHKHTLPVRLLRQRLDGVMDKSEVKTSDLFLLWLRKT